MNRAAEVNRLAAKLEAGGAGPRLAHHVASDAVRHPVKLAARRAWLLAMLKADRQTFDAVVQPGELTALDAALGDRARCRVCGRALEDPDSVRLGIGPDCRRKGAA